MLQPLSYHSAGYRTRAAVCISDDAVNLAAGLCETTSESPKPFPVVHHFPSSDAIGPAAGRAGVAGLAAAFLVGALAAAFAGFGVVVTAPVVIVPPPPCGCAETSEAEPITRTTKTRAADSFNWIITLDSVFVFIRGSLLVYRQNQSTKSHETTRSFTHQLPVHHYLALPVA